MLQDEAQLLRAPDRQHDEQQVGMGQCRYPERQTRRPERPRQYEVVEQAPQDEPVTHQRIVTGGALEHDRARDGEACGHERTEVAPSCDLADPPSEGAGERHRREDPPAGVLEGRRQECGEGLQRQCEERDRVGVDDAARHRLAVAPGGSRWPLPRVVAEEGPAEIVGRRVSREEPAHVSRVENGEGHDGEEHRDAEQGSGGTPRGPPCALPQPAPWSLSDRGPNPGFAT